MYFDSPPTATLFAALASIDLDLADLCRNQRCPFCHGPLHHAPYLRKPRGGPDDLPDRYSVRLSLCCGRDGCRRRVLPPSCLFLGRKVYWAAIVLIVVTLRQRRTEGVSARTLRLTFGVSQETLARWMTFFAQVFPRSELWRRCRGLVPSTVSNDELPASLLALFVTQYGGDEEGGLLACLEFLARGERSVGRRAS